MPTSGCPTCQMLGGSAPQDSAAFFDCPACGEPLGARPSPASKTAGSVSAEPRSFSPQFLERYEILSTLGEGGMGIVYLAVQKRLDRQVAIKFTHSNDAATRARFAREGRLLAKLDHPNIVRVYEAGEDNDHPYLVCEVVDGEALSARIQRDGALPPTEALEIGSQIAAGLAHAHANGILHRDLKSANVLVSGTGVVKVCDFGLARSSQQRETLTSTGLLLGTPSFMAPELVRGAEATQATDIYALGCVLYELITGKLPYPSVTSTGTQRGLAEVLNAHIHEPVPTPVHPTHSIPPELARLIVRCLAKQSELRPNSVEEVGALLHQIQTQKASEPTKPSIQPLGVEEEQPAPTAAANNTGPIRKGRQQRKETTGKIPLKPVSGPAPSATGKKWAVVVAAVLLVAGGGVGAGYVVLRDRPGEAELAIASTGAKSEQQNPNADRSPPAISKPELASSKPASIAAPENPVQIPVQPAATQTAKAVPPKAHAAPAEPKAVSAVVAVAQERPRSSEPVVERANPTQIAFVAQDVPKKATQESSLPKPKTLSPPIEKTPESPASHSPSSASSSPAMEESESNIGTTAFLAPSGSDEKPEAKTTQENHVTDRGGFTEADRKESKELWERGKTYVETYAYAIAMNLFKQSWKVMPTAECGNDIGELYLKGNDLKSAARWFQASLKLLPGYRRASVNLEVTKRKYLASKRPQKTIPQE